ncbi:MAG: hypothetical protein NVS2B6_16920 [Thermoleophilaceae bacterium]
MAHPSSPYDLDIAHGGPLVRLLDARERGADEAALRDWTRAVGAASGAAHVSRSYRHPYALVACHDAPVGIDIERVEPCDSAFADLICTPGERTEAERQADPDVYLSGLWSSKEALSKALGDALLYEPNRLDSPQRWHEGASGPWRAAELSVPAGHVAWVCWRTVDV